MPGIDDRRSAASTPAPLEGSAEPRTDGTAGASPGSTGLICREASAAAPADAGARSNWSQVEAEGQHVLTRRLGPMGAEVVAIQHETGSDIF